MKLDKRKKYYLILDTETATLPFADEYDNKGAIALAKPLIYDIGWVIVDTKGNIHKKASYLVSETFFNADIFNTAYYKEKKPLYFNDLKNKEIKVGSWQDITAELIEDLSSCEMCGAYNAFFDFKKAIIFTERYINALYNDEMDNFIAKQRYACDLINEGKNVKNPNYDSQNFIFRNKKYPLFDIWFMACKYLIDNDEYKNFCLENKYYNVYFSSSAETVYKYITSDNAFAEQHRALQDSEIETDILFASLEKAKKVEQGIVAFPFRTMGTVKKYRNERAEVE